MDNLVIFGAPCAGKGTQSIILEREFFYLHISIGDILRREIKLGTTAGKMAKEMVDTGKMVPNKLIMTLVKKRIAELDQTRPFVFDGIPRTLEQAVDFDRMVGELELSGILFLRLNVSVAELITRAQHRSLSEDRSDDQSLDTINNRIRIYEEETIPVINQYLHLKKIIEINGEKTIQQVHDDIIKVIQS